jgi:hypothetical protein
MIFVIPLHFFIKKNEIWKNKMLMSYFVLISSLSLLFVFLLTKMDATYTTVYSLHQFLENIKFYSNKLYNNDFSIYIILSYLVLIIISIKRNNHTSLLLILGSILFYLPFAFMEHQKYLNYIAITYFFFWASVLLLIKNRIILSLVFLCSVIPSIHIIHHYSNIPLGANEKKFIERINLEFEADEKITLCITPYKKKEKNSLNRVKDSLEERVTIRETPFVWWFLSLGKANKLFNYSNINVVLLNNNLSSCNHLWEVNNEFRVLHKTERKP